VKILWFAIYSLALLNAGWFFHERWHGSVTVFTNVDQGTPLNHGQKSLVIYLPHGVRFENSHPVDCQASLHTYADGVYWNYLNVNIEKWK